MRNKEIWLTGLVVVNLVLLGVLLLGPMAQPASGQVRTGSQDYLMVTTSVEEGWDAAFIIDLKQHRLVGVRMRPGGGSQYKVEEIIGRDLKRDFGN
jgi:hypothetical protein